MERTPYRIDSVKKVRKVEVTPMLEMPAFSAGTRFVGYEGPYSSARSTNLTHCVQKQRSYKRSVGSVESKQKYWPN